MLYKTTVNALERLDCSLLSRLDRLFVLVWCAKAADSNSVDVYEPSCAVLGPFKGPQRHNIAYF